MKGATKLSPRSSLVPEEWKRAPAALLDRRWFEGNAKDLLDSARDEGGVAGSVRVDARLGPAAATGAQFSPSRGLPGAGLAPAAETPDPYEEFRRLLPSDGGVLRIPAGAEVDSRMDLDLWIHGSPSGAPDGACSSALSIVVDDGASARVALRYRSDAAAAGDPTDAVGSPRNSSVQAAALFLSYLEVRLGAGAKLDLVVVSELPAGLRRIDRSVAILDSGAKLKWTEAGFDRGSGRYGTTVYLDGRSADLDFAGAYAASGQVDGEHVLSEFHRAPGTTSRASLKSALKDESRLVFRGLIEVSPDAPGTDAYLSNRNLLLDDGARAESLPQLKIDQDDVACSHGSTTGGPDEGELFYLMSRGLPRQDARELLSLGHLGSVLDRAGGELAAELEVAAAAALGGGKSGTAVGSGGTGL